MAVGTKSNERRVDRVDGVGKWRMMKRDSQREEREDSGWRGREREREMGNRKRERGNLWQRVDRKRSAEKCTTSALVWQLCGRTTACVRKRERERRRERGRDGERGREKGTDGSGRETDVYPPTNTDARGGGREESQAESRWARSGLPEFHTHRALLRVPSRRGEPHEGGGATPSQKRGPPRIPGSREWVPRKRLKFFEKKKKEKIHASRSPATRPDNERSVPKSVIARESR